MESEWVFDDAKMIRKDGDFRKGPPETRRRYTYLCIGHVPPLPLHYIGGVSLLHMDHRLCRDHIFSRLGYLDLFSLAKTCRFVYDDVRELLRGIVRRMYCFDDLDDPLLLHLLPTLGYLTVQEREEEEKKRYGWRRDRITLPPPTIDKTVAYRKFCLDAHDVAKLKTIGGSRKGHERFDVLDVIRACVARHGSLAGMLVYAQKVIDQRALTAERRSKHEDREEELKQALGEVGLDWTSIPSCDAKVDAQKWIQNGTKTTAAKLTLKLIEAVALEGELKKALGTETWDQVNESQFVTSFINGLRSKEATVAQINSMLKRKKQRSSEKAVKQEKKDKFVARVVALGFSEEELRRNRIVQQMDQGILDEEEAFEALSNEMKELQSLREGIVTTFGTNWETELGHDGIVKELKTALQKHRAVDLPSLKAKYDRWLRAKEIKEWAARRGIVNYEPTCLEGEWKQAAIRYALGSQVSFRLVPVVSALLEEKLLAEHASVPLFSALLESYRKRFKDIAYKTAGRVLTGQARGEDLKRLSLEAATAYLVSGDGREEMMKWP